MNPASEAIVRAAWTQLWQVTLVAAIVALVVRLACRRRPHLAYLLWLVVLVKCVTPPVWSSPLGVFSWASRTTVLSEPAVVVAPRFELARHQPAAAMSPNAQQVNNSSSISPATIVPPVPVDAASPPEIRTLSRTELAVAAVAALWFLGAIAYYGWAWLAVWLCRRSMLRARVTVRSELNELLDELSQRLGVRRKVELVVADSIGPLTFGWLQPKIVLPEALAEKPAADLEPILAHELVHVRRGDALAGLLQVASQGLWWFHPLIWLTNRGVSAERERCCDEEVIASLGYEPRKYGRSLLDVLELKRGRRLPAVVPGIRPFEITRQRLDYLVSRSKLFRRRMPRRYWLALATILVFVLPGAGLIRQQVVAAKNADPNTWTVAGRVVDHRGQPVADAEVLLLGPERLCVAAKERTWFQLESPNDKSAWPKSVRTDASGQFNIERAGNDLNRLAVIGADPVYWAVQRQDLPADKPVEIRLPGPGSIAIECDLPGKPAKQEVYINLRTLDDKQWEGDLVRYHLSTSFAKNPGTTVFGHLPPGRYSVERNQSTKTSQNSYLITTADRHFVTVAPAGQADVRFERKAGRPLTGYVRGLENAELRHAHLTISYFGPEEHRGKNGKPIRFMTAFDVIPIKADGKFTTDPIPPGDYMVMLWAQLASTPNQSGTSDFELQDEFTVPAEGEMPMVEFKARPPRTSKRNAEPKHPMLTVVDEAGQPVPRFEIKVWTGDRGSSPWYNGSDGRIPQSRPLWGFEESSGLYLTIRADGFASRIVHFAGAELEKLRRGEGRITLQRGEEVRLRFNLPEGMTWPADYLPDLYFSQLAGDVRILWNPSNRRAYAESGMPDMNMLGARLTAPGEVTLRLAPDTEPVHVGIYAPSFLRYFERGPLTLASFAKRELAIDLEKPATLMVAFDRGSQPDKQLPFENAEITVLWKIPGGGNSAIPVQDPANTEHEPKLLATDLAAGDYKVSVRTVPKPATKDLSDDPARIPTNPGRFYAGQDVALAAGATERITFDYVPYNAEAWRGNRTAVLTVLKSDGSPAAGRQVDVAWFDGHYGNLPVFSGPVPDSGQVVLEGLSDKQHDAMPGGPYAISLGPLERVGNFGFQGDQTRQEFTFRLPPAVGEVVPDVELVNLDSNQETRLSDFRGKLVCIEFWASWCGPCREPLEKLNALAGAKREAWKDRAMILPVSIDEQRQAAIDHLHSHGYRNLEPLWAGEENGSGGWQSPAAKAFGVSGVPTAVLIDRDGRLLWRGHPAVGPDKKDLAARLEEAVGK